MTEQAPRRDTLEFTQPAVGATASDTSIIGEAPYDLTVEAASYTPDANITGANSPASRTVNVVNRGTDGSGTTVVATLAFVSGVNAVAGDEKALTLSGTAANLNVDTGAIIAFESLAVTSGTGLADPGGLVQLNVSRR